MLPDGIHRLNLAHDLKFIAINAARQITADRPPTIAAIIRAIEASPAEVEPCMGVRADQKRGIPVEYVRRIARFGARFDIDILTAEAIMSHEPAVLPLTVHDVGVFVVDLRLKTVAAHRDEPVFVRYRTASGARRRAQRIVVLRSAIDVIERLGIIDADAIELRQRQIRFVLPVRSAVPRLVHTAITPDDHVGGIVRVNPQRVIIDMAVAPLRTRETFAAIGCDHQERIEDVNRIYSMRIAHDLVVVHRCGCRSAVALGPALASISGTEESAFAFLRFDDGIDHIRIRRRDIQPDLAFIAARQTARQFPPRLPAIGGLVDCGFRSAVDHRPHTSPSLIGGCVQHIGIARVEMNFIDAGVFGGMKDAFPARAAVSGLVKSAIAPGPPERSLRRNVNDIRIPGVDGDHSDVFGLLEAHVLEVLAAIDGLVHTVAERDASLTVVLAGPDPNDVVVARVDLNAADRIRALAVEDWRVGGAVVGGLPYAARRDGDEVLAVVVRVYGKVADAPGHEGRPK